MNVVVGKIVDIFLPPSVQRHAEAVSEARQANAAIGLHEDVTRSDITAFHRIIQPLNQKNVKVWTLAIAPLTSVRLVTSSALQSRKRQLIGIETMVLQHIT